MRDNPWFTEWFRSPFYHKLYFGRDEREANAFIHKLVAHLKPEKGSRMLDVACGRGRHSKTLASLGFNITGIDISPESIAYAKKFENENLEFFLHDMRLPFRVNYYDYVFNFFTSFGYFKTRREHDNAMHTLTSSLKEGGSLVIDYLNVHYEEDHIIPSATKKINTTIYDIKKWDDSFHFYKKISINDASLPKPLEFTEQVAKFSLGDFTDMLSYQQIQIQEVFGDYQLGHYDIHKSPRLIIIAKK